VWVTVPNPKVGRRLARALVEGRLAACVGLMPGLESCYRWKGRIERASECLLLAKTARYAIRRLGTICRAHHPNEVLRGGGHPDRAGERSVPSMDRRELRG
jgi:periplasmic divalent cation tolerance protein